MNKVVLWAIFALLASSCTVYKEYSIDVLQPGKITIPRETKKAAIVYRNFKYYNDTLQHYYKRNFRLKKARRDPARLDSTLANICINKLAADLKKHKTFDEIRIFPELFKMHRGRKMPMLNAKLTKKIAASFGVDVLISLETYSYFYSEYPATGENGKSNKVITAAVWAVFYPNTSELLDRKTMVDTVFWNNMNDDGSYNQNKLPPRIPALKMASQLAGESYARRFFSSWQTVKRIYFVSSGGDFEAADKYVQKGEWDKAIELWKRNAGENNGKKAIRACYNLAFAYEMKDELDISEKWLVSAQKIAEKYHKKEDRKTILKYWKIIQQRKKDIALINQQGEE